MKNEINMQMAARIRFNREIRETDYISPGSYEIAFRGADGVKDLQIDFCTVEGNKDAEDPSVLQIICKDLDEQAFEDLEAQKITSSDLNEIAAIRDFYVYTGEPYEEGSDLAPLELVELSLEVYEDDGLIRSLSANKESMEAISNAWVKEQERVNDSKKGLKKFYFTFGSSEGYPSKCRNGYVVIKAADEASAVKTFRRHYPDRIPGVVNCAFWYNEKRWNEICARYYVGVEPAEVWTDGEGREPWTA